MRPEGVGILVILDEHFHRSGAKVRFNAHLYRAEFLFFIPILSGFSIRNYYRITNFRFRRIGHGHAISLVLHEAQVSPAYSH